MNYKDNLSPGARRMAEENEAKKDKEFEDRFRAWLIVWLLFAAGIVACAGAGIFVLAHFIAKWW